MTKASGGESATGSPELLPQQTRLKNLASEMLSLDKDKQRLVNVQLDAAPEDVQARLRASSIGSLLIPDGGSLGAEGDTALDFRVGDAEITSVGLQAWCANEPIIVNDIEWDGAYLAILLHYQKDSEKATQKIAMNSKLITLAPMKAWRSLSVLSYFETGYEGHGLKVLEDIPPDTADEFLGLVEELYRGSVNG
jgi:hypothetical protein